MNNSDDISALSNFNERLNCVIDLSLGVSGGYLNSNTRLALFEIIQHTKEPNRKKPFGRMCVHVAEAKFARIFFECGDRGGEEAKLLKVPCLTPRTHPDPLLSLEFSAAVKVSSESAERGGQVVKGSGEMCMARGQAVKVRGEMCRARRASSESKR